MAPLTRRHHVARHAVAVAIAATILGSGLGSPRVISAQRLSSPDLAAGSGTCLGHRVTDVVQPDEEWDGTSEQDVVVVLGAGASILTGLGDDIVCVLADPRRGYVHGSYINTGPDNDTVITYGGSNTIDTFDGDDLVYLNGDQESVSAGEGNDHIWGLGATVAYIDGEGGNDLIVGSPGNDVLSGGDGVDMILGAEGDDIIDGDGDPDYLAGGFGFDDIDGGADQDTCEDLLPGGATFASCEEVSNDPGFPESSGAPVSMPELPLQGQSSLIRTFLNSTRVP